MPFAFRVGEYACCALGAPSLLLTNVHKHRSFKKRVLVASCGNVAGVHVCQGSLFLTETSRRHTCLELQSGPARGGWSHGGHRVPIETAYPHGRIGPLTLLPTDERRCRQGTATNQRDCAGCTRLRHVREPTGLNISAASKFDARQKALATSDR